MESFEPHAPADLSPEDVARGRDQALAQMAWTRQYTLQLIAAVPHELWFMQPAGAPTHLAWQVGHLAVAQYGLMLFRQRGRAPGDMELMPSWLRKQYGRGTTPATASPGLPEPEELLERLANIHQRAIEEVQELSPETLLEPIDMPYAAYPIKLGALLFAPIHEALHAGQIGLLRRLHGLEPVR